MQLLFLTLDKGYLLTATPPDLEYQVAPLSPPAPAQPPLLGCGVPPLSRAPGLGHGVAALGLASAQSVAAGTLLLLLGSY